MKALVFEGVNDIKLKEVPMPVLEEGELLLKVKASLICGTDVRIYRGRKTKGVRTPSILGHEFAGVIEEVCGDVGEFKKGDLVSIAPIVPCLKCYYCKHDQENICLNRTAHGYEYDGGFAEYVKIPAAVLKSGNVYKVPEGVSIEDIPLAEPLACCINGQRQSPIKLGDAVVIFGAGPIGLMHLLLAKSSGGMVIVSEPNEKRRETALKLGADIVVDPTSEDLETVVLNSTDGIGADVVIMAIGIPALVNDTLKIARKGGTINLFAGFSVGDMPPVDVNLIHYKELNITGTSASARRDHEKAIRLIKNGTIDASKIITHKFPLDQADEAFRVAESGEGIKVEILP
ncbi:MAG: alcohol dehydrogenase catalytic domain-containing protein [Tissierellia bacterium]|nr:alcohol dehydrogenase catalytic domain-containing protein [Tissierellia bacterium]